jgi:methylated-DNA-[protein]-cysteine S-methyltransferase
LKVYDQIAALKLSVVESFVEYFHSPVGWLKIISDQSSITQVNFRSEKIENENPSELTRLCVLQLEELFNGKRNDFSLPLKPSGTVFQIQVWNELLKIPFGKTISYLELARRLGDEKKIRAAGTANGRNPIPIIIPCHRVIVVMEAWLDMAADCQIKNGCLNLKAEKSRRNYSDRVFKFLLSRDIYPFQKSDSRRDFYPLKKMLKGQSTNNQKAGDPIDHFNFKIFVECHSRKAEYC